MADNRITVAVHSGSFHADDVFAAAVLLKIFEGKPVEVRLIRSRAPGITASADFVIDVGGVYDEKMNRFDHHQPSGAGARENGVPYASFGLVWKKFGRHLSGSEEVAVVVDEMLVQPIDYIDNLGLSISELAPGVYPYTIDRLVASFVSTYEEKDRDMDGVFFRMVAFAKEIIEREIVNAHALEKARPELERAYKNAKDKRIIVLDFEYPWFHVISKYPEPLYVIFPYADGREQWGLSAVRQLWHGSGNRKDFPKEWGGKRGEELARISGVPDAVFCHNQLFVAIAKTRAGAIALASRALEN